MQRWDIINHLIKENDYKNYLEIGYYKGWSFENIRCNFKTAVDPNPCRDDYESSLAYGNGNVLYENGQVAGYSIRGGILIKLTSDDYFKSVPEEIKWNCVFIDGLHEATQVERDIYNSLKHLSEGGTIVLHDMLPPTLEHTTTGDKYGNWNGDCYKALLAFMRDDIFGNYTVRVVDTDWGCGIIQKNEIPLWRIEKNIDFEFYNKAIEDFNYFLENKDKLFNIITPKEFLTLYSK